MRLGTSIFIAAVFAAVSVASGCGISAHRTGAAATRGALQEVETQAQQVESSEPSPLTEVAARGATKGVVSQLHTREQQTQLRAISQEVTRSAVEGAMGSMSWQLGSDGHGPLARSLAATVERVSASAVRGARGEMSDLLPECRGPDRERCLERRAIILSHAVATGFRRGLGLMLVLPALLLSFVLGLIIPIAVFWIRSQRHGERSARGEPR